MDWQPIDTAPTNGEILVFRSDSGPFIARWAWMGEVVPKDRNGDPVEDFDEEHEGWWSDAYGWQEGSECPTHWMPLPKAPDA